MAVLGCALHCWTYPRCGKIRRSKQQLFSSSNQAHAGQGCKNPGTCRPPSHMSAASSRPSWAQAPNHPPVNRQRAATGGPRHLSVSQYLVSLAPFNVGVVVFSRWAIHAIPTKEWAKAIMPRYPFGRRVLSAAEPARLLSSREALGLSTHPGLLLLTGH